jgi:hypothetical protein
MLTFYRQGRPAPSFLLLHTKCPMQVLDEEQVVGVEEKDRVMRR